MKEQQLRKNAERRGYWCARGLSLSVTVAARQHSGGPINYGLLVGKSLLHRIHWTQVGDTQQFKFEKSGRTIFIQHDSRLPDVAHTVIETELDHALAEQAPEERQALLKLAHGGVDKFFLRVPGAPGSGARLFN
jgi:hypothetical protein